MFKTLHAAIIGICFIVGITAAAYLLSQTMLNARTGVNTASVKGLSERIVKADELRWAIDFWGEQSVAVAGNFLVEEFNRPSILAKSNASKDAAIEALTKAGFPKEAIKVSPINYTTSNTTDTEGNTTLSTATMTGTISVVSTDFDKISAAQENLLQAIVAGNNITDNAPRYVFNKLNEIKPDMLREATQNARIAADEFAKNADVTVGGLQDASQGGFEVYDLGAEDSDEATMDKVVRVVVNATFYLEN